MNKTIIRCGHCDSEKIILKYSLISSHSNEYLRELLCAECGYPSLAKDLLDNPIAMQNYIADYKHNNQIINSTVEDDEKFRIIIIEVLKTQVIETLIVDQSNSIIAKLVGYNEC